MPRDRYVQGCTPAVETLHVYEHTVSAAAWTRSAIRRRDRARAGAAVYRAGVSSRRPTRTVLRPFDHGLRADGRTP